MDFPAVMLKKMFQKLPFKPLVAWRELTPASRASVLVMAELAAAAHELGPVEPAAEVWPLYLEAGAEFDIPPELLAAIAAELGAPQEHPGHLCMGLPLTIARSLNARDQVRQVAKVLRAIASARGMGAALVQYCGDARTAGRVAGTAAIMLARKCDLSSADVRAAFAFLEDE
jgi:hypothetical protein